MRLLITTLLALLLQMPAYADAAWSGPATTIGTKHGRKIIDICPQGGTCVQSTPMFLSINSQGAGFTWDKFRYEANRQIAYINPAATGVTPILQVHFSNTSNDFIDTLGSQLNALNARPYLIARFYLETPGSFSGGAKNAMADMQGRITDNTLATGAPWSMTDTWLAYQEQEIERILNRVDQAYPGKTIGVLFSYGDGGEFFYRPYGYQNNKVLGMGSDELCYGGIAPGTSSGCNLFPWSNDSTGTNHGRHYFYLSDHSAATQQGFCNWSALPAAARLAGCPAVSVVDRNNGASGEAMPTLGKSRGVFLNPAEPKSLRAAYYNRYLAHTTVNAITRLSSKAKAMTGGRILTSVFYGYLTGLDAATPTSSHTDLTQLLASGNVDLIVAPYSYRDARQLGSAFSTQGPMHAPALRGKLWIDEDDTRTHFACAPKPSNALDTSKCGDDAFEHVTTLWDSVRILRRNVLSAGLRDTGLYFLDLGGTGWFGREDLPSDSEALWANIHNAYKAVDKLHLRTENGYKPQVAVFIDDLSFNYTAALTPASDYTYAYSTDITTALIQDLDKIGTPVKQYLLSNLTTMSTNDLTSIRLAILPNAFNVPTSLRQAIDTKLKTQGRTVLFIYAAGYMNGDAGISTDGISSLTGLNVTLGTGEPNLGQKYTLGNTSLCGGATYPLTPWFHIQDAAATTLGRYDTTCLGGGTNNTSLAYKSISVGSGSYRSVYAAAPKLPVEVLRHISELAGVHHFTPTGNSVEASGNMLMVHAGSHGHRTIALSAAAKRVFETGLYPSDVLVCSNCAQLPSLYFDKGDTRVFRWTTVPNGNFELILSPATLEGWAADLDTPSTSIQVAIYRGAPKGEAGSIFVANIPTNQPRPDVNQAFDISGVHGFRYPLGSCVSGVPYYAYALDADGVSGDGERYIGQHVCP